MPTDAAEAIRLLTRFLELWERHYQIANPPLEQAIFQSQHDTERASAQMREVQGEITPMMDAVHAAHRAVGIEPTLIDGGSITDVRFHIDLAIARLQRIARGEPLDFTPITLEVRAPEGTSVEPQSVNWTAIGALAALAGVAVALAGYLL